MAAVTDPSGAFIGFWQPGTHKGYGRVAEVGAPCWHELHTRDYAAALGFYRARARVGDQGDRRHRRVPLHPGDGRRRAVRRGAWTRRPWLPEGVPSHWTGLLRRGRRRRRVRRSCRSSAARCVEAPMDTPYGRIATVTDPTGTLPADRHRMSGGEAARGVRPPR